ncbi:MAG: hypothetical protein ACR2JO_07490, partial [Mycobacteriales bacterium]
MLGGVRESAAVAVLLLLGLPRAGGLAGRGRQVLLGNDLRSAGGVVNQATMLVEIATDLFDFGCA